MEGSYNWFWRRADNHARGLERPMDLNHSGRNIARTMVACKTTDSTTNNGYLEISLLVLLYPFPFFCLFII